MAVWWVVGGILLGLLFDLNSLVGAESYLGNVCKDGSWHGQKDRKHPDADSSDLGDRLGSYPACHMAADRVHYGIVPLST